MSNLLMHSMSEFAHLIVRSLDVAAAVRVAEIGAEHGGMTDVLARYVRARQGELATIDPAPSPQFAEWLARNPDVRHLASESLDVIDSLTDVDAWLVDGDHNWYTVYHELQRIRGVSSRDGRPMLAFLHDVGWPCARRDSYYAPERIPAEFCHPHRFDAGVSLDSATLTPGRGFRGMGAFAWAEHEGGERNGVLTAVEDFVYEQAVAGDRLGWAYLPAVFGLGVVYQLDTPWAAALASLFAPYHEDPLLARLEENRLRNYLAVIDWQDRQASRAILEPSHA